jgi:hypothetical protein
MLRTSRWFYVQDPIWPVEKHTRNSWFRKRTLYSDILRVVKENPGISTGDVARKLGRPYPHIAPLLFHLRRFQALKYEPIELERMKG